MKQWIIDRYNKGQDKYTAEFQSPFNNVLIMHPLKGRKSYRNNYRNISQWDFLFNFAWGFAKAFWGSVLIIMDSGKEVIQNPDIPKSAKDMFCTERWKAHLCRMAISPDPLEYLEQFKDAA